MTQQPPASVRSAVSRFLCARLEDTMVGAFLYGSVAAGTAKQGSDIDCLVVLRCEIDPKMRALVSSEYAELQRSLGYEPDLEHPIEMFSLDFCTLTLRSPEVKRALRDGGPDRADSSDKAEVLRAFLDRRISLIPAPELEALTRLATGELNTTIGPRAWTC